MKKMILLIGLLSFIALFAGCTTTNQITENIPKDSKLDQIRIGMSTQKVKDILGEPTDYHHKTTWRAYVPFYGMFASQTYEQVYYYKNLGKVVFGNPGGGNHSVFVRSVQYNPHETGYGQG
jgi:hypothetical protein